MFFKRYLEKNRELRWLYLDEQYYKLHEQIFNLEKNLKKVIKQRDTILPSFLDNGIVDWDWQTQWIDLFYGAIDDFGGIIEMITETYHLTGVLAKI